MGDDGTFYKGVFLMVFAFGTGFGVGYKVNDVFLSSTPRIREAGTVTDVSAFLCFSFFLLGKRMADGMVEAKKGETGS